MVHHDLLIAEYLVLKVTGICFLINIHLATFSPCSKMLQSVVSVKYDSVPGIN